MARPRKEPEQSGELVRMVRDAPQFPGGPVTADVPQSEVENYKAADWREA